MNFEDVQKVSKLRRKPRVTMVNTNFFKYFIRADHGGIFY